MSSFSEDIVKHHFSDITFGFQEMVKENKLIFTFDATKKARFGVLPRYAKDELLIKWFELPNCFIFHNGMLFCLALSSLTPSCPLNSYCLLDEVCWWQTNNVCSEIMFNNVELLEYAVAFKILFLLLVSIIETR